MHLEYQRSSNLGALCDFGATLLPMPARSSDLTAPASWKLLGGFYLLLAAASWMHGGGQMLFCALCAPPGAETVWHLHGVRLAIASVLLSLLSAQFMLVTTRPALLPFNPVAEPSHRRGGAPAYLPAGRASSISLPMPASS